MRNQLRSWWVAGAVLAGVLLGAAARPAFTAPETAAAQLPASGGPFADVPLSHPAYAATHFLDSEVGLFTGYREGTFAGKRKLTRYEFAVALQRMLQDAPRAVNPTPTPVPAAGPVDGFVSGPERAQKLKKLATDPRLQVRMAGWLRALELDFEPELAMLGADTDQLVRNLDALEKRARDAARAAEAGKPAGVPAGK